MRSSFFLKNSNIKFHIASLLFLYTYYFFPLLFTGSLMTTIPDNLNSNVVYNHVAGKIILGDINAIKVFLGGELPWQYLKGVFYPITLIYSFFDIEKSFWITDVSIRTLAYFSFFYLLKKINNNSLYNYLLSLFFASSISLTTGGLGYAAIPYLVGLVIKNKKIKFKNYFGVFFIGLNTDLYIHGIYTIPILVILFFILNFDNYKKNYNNLLKILFFYTIAIIISNSPLIYSLFYLRPFHSEEIIRYIPSYTENFSNFFLNLYGAQNPAIFRNSFFIIIIAFIYFFSFTRKHKININILLFILISSFINFTLNIEFINDLRSTSSILMAVTLNRFYNYYFFFYTICLFFILENRNIKKNFFLIILIISSIFYSLVAPNTKVVFAEFFNYYSLGQENKLVIRDNLKNYDFVKLFKNLKQFDKQNSFNKKNESISSTAASPKSYYQIEDYKFIKNIVGDKKILSINLDSLVPVVSNINVIDGYYYLYPLSYKKKFRKIFSRYYDSMEKENNNSFQNWGHRLEIQTFDENLINFDELKSIGTAYILTNQRLVSNYLTLICKNCNNSNNFNLYKIN